MPFDRLQFFGNPFENTAAIVERQIRSRRLQQERDDAPESPAAEIDDTERRAAMARERMRRAGRR